MWNENTVTKCQYKTFFNKHYHRIMIIYFFAWKFSRKLSDWPPYKVFRLFYIILPLLLKCVRTEGNGRQILKDVSFWYIQKRSWQFSCTEYCWVQIFFPWEFTFKMKNYRNGFIEQFHLCTAFLEFIYGIKQI